MEPNLLEAIAQSAPAQALKGSFWVYPLVNAGHILGISLLIGAIVPLDLRIAGVFRGRVSLRSAASLLVPVAAAGLGLAAITGALLFTVKPFAYAGSDIFVYKIAVIGVGLINIGWVRANPVWTEIVQGDASILDRSEGNLRLRLAAVASLCIWVSVLVLGRLIGYFL